jgi:hypothetical protein
MSSLRRRSNVRIPSLVLCLTLGLAPLAAQTVAATSASPELSEKKDLAIFGLGFYGWAIPLEALGTINMQTRKVFTDLGRFNVIGFEESLSNIGLSEFIAAVKKVKEGSVAVPDSYRFGEVTLTETAWNSLVGAFIVAAPVVTAFQSRWNDKTFAWETNLTVYVTFIDVAAGGSTIGIAEVQSSGSDKRDQVASIRSAIDGIPIKLQYEIRKIPAFQISSKVLSVRGDQVKMALGRNMGIVVGDEYSVVVRGQVSGFNDDREVGLLVVTGVGPEVSTARAIFGQASITADTALQEIPRLGVDLEPYLHIFNGAAGFEVVPGVRAVVSRGFEGFRPLATVQVPLSQITPIFTATIIPIDITVGGEYNFNLWRFSVTGWAGAGVGYVHLSEAITQISTETDFLAHVGAHAWAKGSYLIARDMRLFAEVGFEYWLSLHPLFFKPYGGLGYGAGVELKM